jgi:hypothetical protein
LSKRCPNPFRRAIQAAPAPNRGRRKTGIFSVFFDENVPKSEQNRKKPEKTCGNPINAIDKEAGKAEGELRYGSPHPHEH